MEYAKSEATQEWCCFCYKFNWNQTTISPQFNSCKQLWYHLLTVKQQPFPSPGWSQKSSFPFLCLNEHLSDKLACVSNLWLCSNRQQHCVEVGLVVASPSLISTWPVQWSAVQAMQEQNVVGQNSRSAWGPAEYLQAHSSCCNNLLKCCVPCNTWGQRFGAL